MTIVIWPQSCILALKHVIQNNEHIHNTHIFILQVERSGSEFWFNHNKNNQLFWFLDYVQKTKSFQILKKMYLIFFYRNTSEKRGFTVIQGQEVIFRRPTLLFLDFCGKKELVHWLVHKITKKWSFLQFSKIIVILMSTSSKAG